MRNGKQSRRKSCLCWAPNVIFNDKEDSESTEVFPQDIQIRMDQYQSFIEPSVRSQVMQNILYNTIYSWLRLSVGKFVTSHPN